MEWLPSNWKVVVQDVQVLSWHLNKEYKILCVTIYPK